MSLSSVRFASSVFLITTLLTAPLTAQIGSDRTERWDQDSTGMNQSAESFDLFGRRLAVGDFDGDGADDLAVSALGEALTISTVGYPSAGIVHVLYGGDGVGLSSATIETWSYETPVLAPYLQANSNFGGFLAVGNFNGDFYDDLAIAASRYDAPGVLDAGTVFVIYGSASGLDGSTLQQFWEVDGSVQGTAETQDRFGDRLAVGSLNCDSYDDLAVLIEGQAVGDENNAGAIMVIHGSAGGLQTSDEVLFDHSDLGGTPDSEAFGDALAVAPFDGDACDDLAVGVPEMDLETEDDYFFDIGRVYVVPGSGSGLVTASATTIDRERADILGDEQEYDEFGATLAVWGGEPMARGLAIGVPGTANYTGEVHVIRENITGSSPAQQVLNQTSADLAEPIGTNDGFAESLITADLDGDGAEDLLVGSPSESDVANGAGAAQLYYGLPATRGSTSIDLSRFSRFSEGPVPILEQSESGESFAESFAVGDFDNDGSLDLVIGAPNDRTGALRDVTAGAVYVLYGNGDPSSIFADGFESGDTGAWSP